MDLIKYFGGEACAFAGRLSIYIPDRDQNKQKIADWNDWLSAGISKMAEAAGGCTVFYNLPSAYYFTDKAAGKNKRVKIHENTHIIYSYFFSEADLDKRKLNKIRSFMYAFAMDTGQHSVMLDWLGPNQHGQFEVQSTLIFREEIAEKMSELRKKRTAKR